MKFAFDRGVLRLWHLVFAGVLLSFLVSCGDPLVVGPYFDGVRTGTYTYSEQVDGVPSDVTSVVTFATTATVTGENRYIFEGTAELLGRTYTLTGVEELPPQMRLRPQSFALQSSIRMDVVDEKGAQTYTFCGEHFYGTGGGLVYDSEDRGVTLMVLAGRAEDPCYWSASETNPREGDIALPPATRAR